MIIIQICIFIMYFQNNLQLDLQVLISTAKYLYFHIEGLLVTFHQSVLKSLLPLLVSQRMAVRKRTIIAIGKLHILVTCNYPAVLPLKKSKLLHVKWYKSLIDRPFGGICQSQHFCWADDPCSWWAQSAKRNCKHQNIYPVHWSNMVTSFHQFKNVQNFWFVAKQISCW